MTVSDWVSVASAVVSVAAFAVSIVAIRQRARYHPQPSLEIEWSDRLEPVSGLFFRSATVRNHGDAPARDLTVTIPTATRVGEGDWFTENILEPGHSRTFRVPVVDGVSVGQGGTGAVYLREGAPDTYRLLTPSVVIRWRQVPFSAGPRKMTSRAPKTPDLLNGETA